MANPEYPKCPRCGLHMQLNRDKTALECIVKACDYSMPIPVDVEARLLNAPRLFD